MHASLTMYMMHMVSSEDGAACHAAGCLAQHLLRCPSLQRGRGTGGTAT